jgi:protocatechuate 3,4-dioxygenase, alpha subunit
LSLPRTPSQTVGPYLALAMRWTDGPYVVPDGTAGAVWIRGRLLDGVGEPIDDGVIETWQPDTDGRFPTEPDPAPFRGFGRAATDSNGEWGILTVKPRRGADAKGSPAAPYLSVAVFARGLLKPAWTRIYFGDEAEANDRDPVLALVDPDRRRTLVAAREDSGYRLDIRLQGDDETVFFDV